MHSVNRRNKQKTQIKRNLGIEKQEILNPFVENTHMLRFPGWVIPAVVIIAIKQCSEMKEDRKMRERERKVGRIRERKRKRSGTKKLSVYGKNGKKLREF